MSCPVCGGETELKDEEGVQTLYCTNPYCMAKRLKLLTHFVSRDAMNIAGLSEMTLEKFVGENMIHELSDVFKLANLHHNSVIDAITTPKRHWALNVIADFEGNINAS